MTNIQKKSTEQTMEKVGTDVETVDMRKYLREQEIARYKNLKHHIPKIRTKRNLKNLLKDFVSILRILNMKVSEFI